MAVSLLLPFVEGIVELSEVSVKEFWRAFFLSWILCSGGGEPKVYIFLCTGLFICF